GKHPRIIYWLNTASIDPAQIRQWWATWPHANVGILTGERSGLAVLDVDPRNGGDLALEDLTQSYGPLPETPMVISGGKGHPSQCANRSIFAWPEFSPLRRGYHFCRPFVACVPS